MISAIGIKKLWYSDPLTAAPTSGESAASGATPITNVHQDTWSIDESEPSQDSYRNQLNGKVYRMGAKTLGDVTFNFTIGRYDWATKEALMGGTSSANGWARGDDRTNIKKALIALTEDDVYCILTNANIVARESNTDGAVGISVVGTAMDNDTKNVASEYWFEAATQSGSGGE